MFDLPADSLYVWLGVSMISAAFLGVTLSLPATAPANAGPLTASIDRVAASPYNATGEHPLNADRINIGPHTVAVSNGDGTSHGTLAYGPITPVPHGTPLWRVLHGAPPGAVFEDAEAFEAACLEAQRDAGSWQGAPTRVTVRKLMWEGVNATLVSA